MNTIIANKLSQIIESKESKENNVFKPNRQFFKDVEIGQKRFWQLVRNEKNLTILEMKRLASYFGVHILELHDFTLKYLSEDNPISQKNKLDYKKYGLVKS
ncbi:hypothetical protein V9L05_07575 [Bernardetia sp. Wsw4-3y2]|uniref:hypothetical protein n=1 Tax=Bernardetia sp. Wsw4-3y2 TaxID=3127471 RepID=UPI0030D5B35B